MLQILSFFHIKNMDDVGVEYQDQLCIHTKQRGIEQAVV